MATSLVERIVNRVAERTDRGRASRRGFLGGAALVGAALAVDPLGYLTRPASAYDAVCGSDNTCAAGYTVFCCTINGGNNTCPPDSFVGGWWKADHSSFCGGNARYYIDCNAYRDGHYTCHCNTTTCDQRRVACNQFRYGQCNTQIPWSATGPVLCRMVSCTPPWVQFGGTCSSSSATDNNTATHAAPCLTGRNPVGVVDQITSSGNTVYVKGWAYDPDSPATSIRIAIYQDGKGLTSVTANQPRADVNSSRHIPGNHGFSASFTTSSGHHTFTVFAMNIGGGSGNPQIGGRTLIVNPGTAPIGHLDAADPVGDSVVLTGWAFDRDVPSTSIGIAVYQDGKRLPDSRTTGNRPDVNAAYHITGLHGFHLQFKASVGAHNYKVYAINAGGGTGNPLIGNHSLIVRGTAPSALEAPAGALQAPAGGHAVQLAGRLESVSAAGTSVRLVGWVLDSGDSDEPLAVAVHEDEQVLHWYPVEAAGKRASGAAHGRRAFDLTIPAGTGVHTYTVYALAGTDQLATGTDQPAAGTAQPAAGTDHPMIGRQTVRVNQAGAIGHVEEVRRLGDTVRIAGWAHDPDRPDARLALTVFRDGVALPESEAALAQGLVSRGLVSRGLVSRDESEHGSGFDISVADLPGTHTYTVYAAAEASVASGGRVSAKASMIGGRTLAEDDELAARQGALL